MRVSSFNDQDGRLKGIIARPVPDLEETSMNARSAQVTVLLKSGDSHLALFQRDLHVTECKEALQVDPDTLPRLVSQDNPNSIEVLF